MHKDRIYFKLQLPKPRHHRMLFDDDLPFKPKVVPQKKTKINRKPKHKNTEFWVDNE